MKTKLWYVANSTNQGLVVEEETGRNVAVTYDKADAPLVSAAPDLRDVIAEYRAWGPMTGSDRMGFDRKFDAALAKARGE